MTRTSLRMLVMIAGLGLAACGDDDNDGVNAADARVTSDSGGSTTDSGGTIPDGGSTIPDGATAGGG